MTDLSSTLDAILQTHNARLQQHRRSIHDLTDEFLKQAYRIQSNITQLHTYLRSIRGPYLSTTAPPRTKRTTTTPHNPSPSLQSLTNPQRDSIDSASKSTLRDLNHRLTELTNTETQRKKIRLAIRRKQAEKRLGGRLGQALGKWAAGEEGQKPVVLSEEEQREEERERMTDEWREGVIWYLRMRLGEAVECQRDMMERRVRREMERGESVLYKSAGGKGQRGAEALATALMEDGQVGGGGGGSGGIGSVGGGGGAGADAGFTSAQLQEFAEENNAMLRHYESSLDQVRAAEKSMIEIAELQTTLVQNLEIQSERIDQLTEDSLTTGENVSGGNKQLRRAAERWRPAKWMFYVSCGLSGFLIVWDLII